MQLIAPKGLPTFSISNRGEALVPFSHSNMFCSDFAEILAEGGHELFRIAVERGLLWIVSVG